MINKVLIATDGSAHATKAVEFGADIAARYDAAVILVHVLLRHEVSDDLKRMIATEHMTAQTRSAPGAPAVDIANFFHMGTGPQTLPDAALTAIAERVLDRAEDIATDRGVDTVIKRVEDGNPVAQILAVARDENVDLIVSGARGLSDLEALFVGSVSHKLAHLAPVTCLTVR